MSLKFTRQLEYAELTATNSNQDYTMSAAVQKLIINVLTSSGEIRVQLNGVPETLSGTDGIRVVAGTPLVLDNHIINKTISYIRENGQGSDVLFQVIGMRFGKNQS